MRGTIAYVAGFVKYILLGAPMSLIICEIFVRDAIAPLFAIAQACSMALRVLERVPTISYTCPPHVRS
jgi:hypothetical protein